MKTTLTLLLALLATIGTTVGQIANDNTFSAQIDGKDYKTQPRRIQLGRYWWVTANSVKPDQSIRIWLGNFDKTDNLEPGNYMIVDADKGDTKENWKKAVESGQFKGLAIVKYVLETKEPRMEYHVGKSRNAGEMITVTKTADGFLEGRFDCALAGTYWKEKTTATVFGGVGRLMDKAQDKVITKTTGYESDIDPEGNGYRRQDKTDEVVLKNATFRLKQ
jgi:hypothetical protein